MIIFLATQVHNAVAISEYMNVSYSNYTTYYAPPYSVPAKTFSTRYDITNATMTNVTLNFYAYYDKEYQNMSYFIVFYLYIDYTNSTSDTLVYYSVNSWNYTASTLYKNQYYYEMVFDLNQKVAYNFKQFKTIIYAFGYQYNITLEYTITISLEKAYFYPKIPVVDDLLTFVPYIAIFFTIPAVMYHKFKKQGFVLGTYISIIVLFISDMLSLFNFVMMLIANSTIAYLILKLKNEDDENWVF